MRRYLFAAIASIALLAAVPASSMARSHHKRVSHHRRHHHVRAHTRRFGNFKAGAGSWENDQGADAGTIVSFTPDNMGGGTLTIQPNAAGSSPVTGQVTPDTEIDCQGMEDNVRTDDGGPGPSGGGDQGDRGDDRGDDNDNENNDEANNQSCLSALTPGTAVRRAELRISDAGAIWDHVQLDVPGNDNNDNDQDDNDSNDS
jgi:hypothetical protein